MHQRSDFVPLHLHSEYSLLDGAIRINELIPTAIEMGMPAVAVTDHGNLFGAVEFYKKAAKAGIKPIIGCEVYVAPKSRLGRERSENEESSFHLILLAETDEGYKNLLRLVSKAYTEGFYYKPRIDHDLLSKHSAGLIAMTACMKGEVPYLLKRDMAEKAKETALKYMDIMGRENFFIELQENGLEEQIKLNAKLYGLAQEIGVGVVATNDCHYLKKEDARAHDVLLCIQTGKTFNDPKRLRFDSESFYFHTPEEMKAVFKEIPQAILATRGVADRCNVQFKLGESLLPKFEPPGGMTPQAYVEKLAREGLSVKVGSHLPEAYSARLAYELSVIEKMGFASYFLIVWDFITHARSKGIPVGPGRGSAAGSLVAYGLGITEIDPLKYGLLFERFLNPERLSMPDMDTDFCKSRRPEVISYVAEKYGAGHVAQIITFGTMAAKAAIRDVARALDYPYSEADRLAKLVPETLKMTIAEALRLEPQLKELYESNPKVKEILDIAGRLEGLARHASTHAAGVVISPAPLTDITPLYRNPSDESITTQFDMGSVESIGLVKFDLLGLKTLTVIDKTLKYIKDGGTEIKLKDIPLDDKDTYALLGSGQTTGIFQLESSGMRDILVKMQPSRFEDLIALVALYRPGPIGSGMIDDFIKRKKGLTAVKYDLPVLKDVLDETYGVIVYQEQVMSIAHRVAGFSMGRADALRKAMGKKLPEEMEKHKERFISGAVENGIPKKKAVDLFELMAKFAEYGFNKSHSAAYAAITYQTAYLKAHYPVEFMAATLSADLDSTDKIVKSIKECRSMGIDILPPDINRCGMEFNVRGKAIRFGLGAVKGVGGSAVESILDVRAQGGQFASVEDFLSRIDSKKVNKKVLESLVKAGAFDSAGSKEGEALIPARIAAIRAEAFGKVSSPSAPSPSLALFGKAEESHGIKPWDEAELLRNEKEALGFYITGSPLSRYKQALIKKGIRSTSGLEELSDHQETEAAGIVAAIRKVRTSKGDFMAYVTLEDDEGSVETVIFPDLLRNNPELIKKDSAIIVKGALEKSDKGIKLVAREVYSLEERLSRQESGSKMEICIKAGVRTADTLQGLRRILAGSEGPMPLYLRIRTEEPRAEALILAAQGVRPDGHLVDRLEGLLGKGAVRML